MQVDSTIIAQIFDFLLLVGFVAWIVFMVYVVRTLRRLDQRTAAIAARLDEAAKQGDALTVKIPPNGGAQ